MNVLLIGLLSLICLLLLVIAARMKPPTEKKGGVVWEPPNHRVEVERTQMMGELVEQMRERESRVRDEELAEYAAKRRKHQPLLNPVMTQVQEDRVHTTNLKAEKILIPENLSEEEKQALRDFYNL